MTATIIQKVCIEGDYLSGQEAALNQMEQFHRISHFVMVVR